MVRYFGQQLVRDVEVAINILNVIVVVQCIVKPQDLGRGRLIRDRNGVVWNKNQSLGFDIDTLFTDGFADLIQMVVRSRHDIKIFVCGKVFGSRVQRNF